MIKYLIVGLLLATNVWAQSLDKIVAQLIKETTIDNPVYILQSNGGYFHLSGRN